MAKKAASISESHRINVNGVLNLDNGKIIVETEDRGDVDLLTVLMSLNGSNVKMMFVKYVDGAEYVE